MRAVPVVLATRNAGKTEELRRLLADFPVTVRNLDDFGPIPVVEEDGRSFEENAVKKARGTAKVLGLPALADDSGLCVKTLDGAPGVHSARFAGDPRSDERNNERLLELLAHRENRAAHYYCVLVLLHHAHDPQPLVAEGEWRGEILRELRGTGGFGYDPLFLDPFLSRSGAELPLDEKSRVSHRGKALASLLEKLKR